MREPPAIDTTAKGMFARAWAGASEGNWPRTLLVVVLVGAVLAAAGGFGTGRIPVAVRFTYWLTLVVLGAVLGRFGGRRIIPRPWWETRPVTVTALMTLLIGLPVTLAAALGSDWIRRRPFHPAHILEVLPSTLATTAAMVVLAFLVERRDAVATHDGPSGAPPPRFLNRLPAKLAGADLLAVEAQDHYLRLYTSKGEDLILLRLADAIAELEGIEGARTHRSWWVARQAVIGAERGDGRATLTLSNGVQAPVSRAYVKPLRAAGWF